MLPFPGGRDRIEQQQREVGRGAVGKFLFVERRHAREIAAGQSRGCHLLRPHTFQAQFGYGTRHRARQARRIGHRLKVRDGLRLQLVDHARHHGLRAQGAYGRQAGASQRPFGQIHRQSGERHAMHTYEAGAARCAREIVGRAARLRQHQDFRVALQRREKLGRAIEQNGVGGGLDQTAHLVAVYQPVTEPRFMSQYMERSGGFR